MQLSESTGITLKSCWICWFCETHPLCSSKLCHCASMDHTPTVYN